MLNDAKKLKWKNVERFLASFIASSLQRFWCHALHAYKERNTSANAKCTLARVGFLKCRNAGLSGIRSVRYQQEKKRHLNQSGTGIRLHSPTFLRSRTEMMDAGMPILALVFSMPMPSNRCQWCTCWLYNSSLGSGNPLYRDVCFTTLDRLGFAHIIYKEAEVKLLLTFLTGSNIWNQAQSYCHLVPKP